MHILSAGSDDLETVAAITHATIAEIYPQYYPEGAVAFFHRHHSNAAIREDIAAGTVYLLLTETEEPAGTVTIRGNEICRLFVLPRFQGNGYGRALLDFAEAKIAEHFREIILDASLPAKTIYQKRGYRETAYHVVPAGEQAFLCYDEMRKEL